jgi:hypothetical protein
MRARLQRKAALPAAAAAAELANNQRYAIAQRFPSSVVTTPRLTSDRSVFRKVLS